jgi:beta-lactamase regulating signal transducer with metallopeptidase domain
MITILNQMAEKWYGWELAMLWQAGLLIAIVAAIDLLIKKWAWPQVRYALWLLILVKLVLPPGLTSPTSFTAEIPFMVKQAAVKINQPQISPQTVHPIEPAVEMMTTKTEEPPAQVRGLNRVDFPDGNDIQVSITWKGYILLVWLGGAAILAGWLVIRLHGLRREHLEDESQILPERLEGLLAATGHKLNLRRIPQVILTDKVCCPAVFGVFRPVLLMPAGKLQNMTMQDAENIFLHELAHIKRGDLFVHAIYMILQIAYWFNPLVWLVRKPLQNLRELCCDATVARLLREKTDGYRQTLLETARELLTVPVDPGLGLLGLFENSSWLLDRLHWLEKKSWKYRPLRIATVFILICLMSACVLPMAKFEAPADFIIRGTVTDVQTGKPIAGAKVGDTEEYADGRFGTTTDSNGDYSYKTWYEEHGIKAIADGYKEQRKGLLTKLFGSEKEKVIDFALKPEKRAVEQAGRKAGEAIPHDKITDTAQIKNMMITMSGTFSAARTAIQSPGGGTKPAAKIMEEGLPQFEKFESAIEGTNISDSVHLIIEQIRQAIKANKEGDSARVAALITASGDSWSVLTTIVMSDNSSNRSISLKPNLETGAQIGAENPAGQDKQKEANKSKFEQLLRNPVTLDISSSPDGAQQTIQNAVNAICEAVGVPYQREISTKLIEHPRWKYMEPIHIKDTPAEDAIRNILKPYHLNYRLNANGLYLYHSTRQGVDNNETNKVSESSGAEEKVKARALRVTIYEGDKKEPQTNVNIPLAAVRILRQILPAKDKLQIIAQNIKLDESLPEDINSAMLIDMLDEMLKQIDAGVEATTLVEVKDGNERIIIALE